MSIDDVERFKHSVIPTPITFFERLGLFFLGGFAGIVICVVAGLLYGKLIAPFPIGLTAVIVVFVFSLCLAIVSAVFPRKMSKFLLFFTFFSPSGPSN